MQHTYFTTKELEGLLAMQYQLDKLLHPDPYSQDWNYRDAIIDELQELRGHLGWKWWKSSNLYKQGMNDANHEQIKLEVIDILHFTLSELNKRDLGVNVRHALFSAAGGEIPKGRGSFTRLSIVLDNFICGVAGHCSSYTLSDSWALLAKTVGLTPSECVRIYLRKYALNKFRWDNGYGAGLYNKHWAGLEDNEILEQQVSSPYYETVEEWEDVVDTIYGELSAIHNRIFSKGG